MRKYPNPDTLAVIDLVLGYHILGSILQSPFRKLKRNWIGPLRMYVLDNTQYTLFVF